MPGLDSDDLAAGLPFAVDDYPAAGRACATWRATGRQADFDTVRLWAYCYVQRHLYGRFAREHLGAASDVEIALTRAYDGALNGLDTIDDPLLFPHFVSVVCKRAVLRHREQRRWTVEADDTTLEPDDAELPSPYEAEAVRAAIDRAIAALPDAIREIGHLRYGLGLDYETIAERVGRPIATVRTYAARARNALADDPTLRALHYDDVLPPGADPDADPDLAGAPDADLPDS